MKPLCFLLPGRKGFQDGRISFLFVGLILLLLFLLAAPAARAEVSENGPYEFPPDLTDDFMCRCLMEELKLNRAAAAGITANMISESGIRTTALGDYGTSFGLCQWHCERYARLVSFAGDAGLPAEDLDVQLRFLKSELEGHYIEVLDYLESVPDTAQGACDAAGYFSLHYEKPAGMQRSAQARGETAKKLYENGLEELPFRIPVMKILYMLNIYRTAGFRSLETAGSEIRFCCPDSPDAGPVMSYDDRYWNSLQENEQTDTWLGENKVLSPASEEVPIPEEWDPAGISYFSGDAVW